MTTEQLSANQHTPIFLAHGTIDPIVPLTRAQATAAELQRLGYTVRWHPYPMPHSVCPQEISDISQFLREVLR